MATCHRTHCNVSKTFPRQDIEVLFHWCGDLILLAGAKNVHLNKHFGHVNFDPLHSISFPLLLLFSIFKLIC